MKSKTSLFDPGLFRHLLRRFWPLCLGYFVLLVLLLPVSLPSITDTYGKDSFTLSLAYEVLNRYASSVVLSFGAGVCFAGAMFHFLFQSRSCGMIHSLPLRRETIFTTAWLAGLLPMLLADLLVMLITWLLNLECGVRVFEALAAWLCATVLANLFYYHFAILCAQLTGKLVILPLVYVVLNFTAFAVTNCADELLCTLLYGVAFRGGYLAWASPLVMMLSRPFPSAVTTNGELSGYAMNGLDTLGVYALVSLLFLALALWLYRRRHLESASHVVAVPVLKPVFKYCMCFGTALVFATMLLVILELDHLYAWGGALVLLLLLLIGAFLGYFVAEMLLRKSLRVFRGAWRGFLVSAAVLCLLLAVVKTDVFSVQRRVPAPDEISAVSIAGTDFFSVQRRVPEPDEISAVSIATYFTEPEDIAAAAAFHRHLIERGPEIRNDGQYRAHQDVFINYGLADGRVLRRSYEVYEDEDALVKEYLALVNHPNAILNRLNIGETETVWIGNRPQELQMQISGGEVLSDGAGSLLELTASEAKELYEQGVLPDARAGRIDLRRSIVYFDFRGGDVILALTETPGNRKYEDFGRTIYLRICPESENTLRWLEAHGLTLDFD